MKVLITGGAGFMGSHFVKYILKKYPYYRVINLDKLTYAGNPNNLKEIEKNPHYKFVKGDIADKDLVSQLTKGVNAIVNYAAETHVDRSILEPEDFVKTDVLGTLNLLEVVRQNKVGRFVQISTDEVFGSIESGEFVEASTFQPNSPYSASKAGGDLLCRAYWETYQTPVIVTHSCNFYGPNQYPEKLISLFITNLIENKKVPLYGDGLNRREWIYPDDHHRAIDLILHKGKVGEVYNIGTGEEKTNREITEVILKEFDKNASSIEYVTDRAGHDKRYRLNFAKLTSLGWQPEIKFADGIKKTIAWYKENEWWWKPLKSGDYLEYYRKQYQQR